MDNIRPMNLASVDLNLLVALDALLEEGNVSAAGRRVGLSQPAMSHALGRLRELLGDRILVRTGPAMAATPYAEALRPGLKAALAQILDVLRPPSFDPATSTRCFRLAMSDYAAYVVLPRLRAGLNARAPGVSLDLTVLGPGAGPVEAMAARIDAVITCESVVPARFRGQPLYLDRDVVALQKGSPGKKEAMSLAGFLASSHVAVVESPDRPDPVDAWLESLGLARRIVARVPQYLMALQLVSASGLVAVIPKRLVDAFAGPLNLRRQEVPLDAGSFTEFLLHPDRAEGDPGNAWLRAELLRMFSPKARGAA
jgi:DNA-binding transcriptional LysR family regulator